jgi:hypothetical protein
MIFSRQHIPRQKPQLPSLENRTLSTNTMTLSRTDRSELQHCIRNQKQKVNAELDKIVKMKATQSAYPAMSRQDKRVAEYHADRMTQETSLQRDMQKAERMADRIAQVLEQLRADFNEIVNHIGNYDFPAEEPSGATAGNCLNDFSAALDSRQAWKDTLCCMLKNVRNYAENQYLGDYKILHGSNAGAAVNDAGTAACCCPLGYRPEFVYRTPVGDCLRLGEKGKSIYTTTVQNGDLAIDTLFSTVCEDPQTSLAAQEAWFNTVYGIVVAHKPTELEANWTEPIVTAAKVAAKAALEASGLVPTEGNEIAELLTNGKAGTTTKDAFSFVDGVFFGQLNSVFAYNNTANAGLSGNEGCFTNVEIDDLLDLAALSFVAFAAGEKPDGYPGSLAEKTRLNTIYGWSYPDTTGDSVLELLGGGQGNGSLVNTIADESDTAFVTLTEAVCAKVKAVRLAQLQNDQDKKTINYVREVSECNQAYHEQVYGEHTSIDETALCQRYEIGSAMLSDLDVMYRENCVSKQSFFKDVTRSGC